MNDCMEYMQTPMSLKIQAQKCFYPYKDTKIPKLMSSSLFFFFCIFYFCIFVSLVRAGFSLYMMMALWYILNFLPFHSPIKGKLETYKVSKC